VGGISDFVQGSLPSPPHRKEQQQSNCEKYKRPRPDPKPAIAAVTADNDASRSAEDGYSQKKKYASDV
jgi:hypothetical protein